MKVHPGKEKQAKNNTDRECSRILEIQGANRILRVLLRSRHLSRIFWMALRMCYFNPALIIRQKRSLSTYFPKHTAKENRKCALCLCDWTINVPLGCHCHLPPGQ